MNRFVKMFLCMSIVAVVLQNSLSIRAATKDSSVVTSYIYVNAGSTAYSTETSTKIVDRPLFYMRLKWFKFQYYPENSMPAGRYIYARLCEAVTKANASGIASFSGTTAPGNYNYTYSSGYGGLGESYVIKVTSSYSLTGFEVIFDWNADAYT